MPLPKREAPRFREIAALSASRSRGQVPLSVQARLHALAARACDLEPAQFHHILNTFPLVPRAERDAALTAFCDIVS